MSSRSRVRTRRNQAEGRYGIFVPLVLCLLLLAPALGQQRPIERHLAEAVHALNEGRLADAQHLAEQVLSQSPENAAALEILGVAFDRQGKFAEAQQVYEKVLKLGRNATLLNNVGNHFLAQGKREPARKYFEDALRLDPANVNARYQLATMDADDSRPKSALAHLSRLPQEEQRQPAALLLKARSEFQLHDANAARSTLKSLGEAKDSDPRIAFSLGAVYYRGGLFSDAVSAFEAALQRLPGDYDILYNLGLASYGAGDKERARQVFERALAIRPRASETLYHLALISRDLGRHDEASEFLVRALQFAPDNAELTLELARECARQQFWDDAAEAYTSFLRLEPNDCDASTELALVDAHRKHLAEAIAPLDRCLANKATDADAHYMRGLIRFHLGQADQAVVDLREAVRLNPRLSEAWVRLGEIERENSHAAEAERCFRAAVQSAPSNASAVTALGQLLNDQKRYDESIRLLAAFVERNPAEAGPRYQLARAYRLSGNSGAAQLEMSKFAQARDQEPVQQFERKGLIAFLRGELQLTPKERDAHEIPYLQRVLALRPKDDAIRARLLSAYLNTGKSVEANRLAQDWIASDGSGSAFRVGAVFAASGQYAQARQYFNEVPVPAHLSDSGGNVGPYWRGQLGVADADLHLGDTQAGLQTLQRFPEKLQASADYQLVRAAIMIALRRFDDADAAYRRALLLASTREDIYVKYGGFAIDENEPRKAVEIFRTGEHSLPDSFVLASDEISALVLAGHPADALARAHEVEKRWPEEDLPYIAGGLAAYRAGRMSEAEAQLENAAALNSGSPIPYYLLGRLEIASRRPDVKVARRWMDRALQKDPKFAPARESINDGILVVQLLKSTITK